MSNQKIEIDIIANDDASAVFKKVASGTVSMADKINSSIINFGNGLRSYNISMNDFNRTALRVFESAGRAVYNFTKEAVTNFSELEYQHAKTLGAMANNYDKTADAQARFLQDSEKLKQQSIKLGTVGPDNQGALYKANQVSAVQTELIKSGITANDITNSDAVEQILKFAGGNDLDINSAADFAVNLGNTYKLKTSDWGKYLNEVTRAADISTVDVPDLMESIKYAGGITSGLNVPLEQVLGALSVMGNAGLKGTMSGTGLQAFFTRILNPFDPNKTSAMSAPAPDDKVKNAYTDFTSKVTDNSGNLLDIDQITPMMDETMSQLNDKEQAWFAQKLFGLFQMKAAFALKRTGTNGENILGQSIDDITNNSSGTNDNKWNIMLSSQQGGMTALQNAYNGISVDVGDRLSPAIKAAQTELYNYLTNNGNYTIDFDKLKAAVKDSGNKISDQYGKQLGDLVNNLGDMGIDGSRILAALFPEVTGIGGAVTKLLGGDINGALSDFSNGIGATNKNIEGLPDGLRKTADGARDVVAAFAILSGLDLAAKVLEVFTNVYRATIGKAIGAINAKIQSATTSVETPMVDVKSATTVHMNANIVYLNGRVAGGSGGGGKIGGGGGTGGEDEWYNELGGGAAAAASKLPTTTTLDNFKGMGLGTALAIGAEIAAEKKDNTAKFISGADSDQANMDINKTLYGAIGDVTGTDAYKKKLNSPDMMMRQGFANNDTVESDNAKSTIAKNEVYNDIIKSIPDMYTDIWADKTKGLSQDDMSRVEGVSFRYVYDKQQAGVVVTKEEYSQIVDQLVGAIKQANLEANNAVLDGQADAALEKKNSLTAQLPAGYYPQPAMNAVQFAELVDKFNKSQPINNQITTQTTVEPKINVTVTPNVNVSLTERGLKTETQKSTFEMNDVERFEYFNNYMSQQASRYGGGK